MASVVKNISSSQEGENLIVFHFLIIFQDCLFRILNYLKNLSFSFWFLKNSEHLVCWVMTLKQKCDQEYIKFLLIAVSYFTGENPLRPDVLKATLLRSYVVKETSLRTPIPEETTCSKIVLIPIWKIFLFHFNFWKIPTLGLLGYGLKTKMWLKIFNIFIYCGLLFFRCLMF